MRWLAILIVAVTSLLSNGDFVFDQHCSSCHTRQKMTFEQMKAQRDMLKAPAMSVIIERLKTNIHVDLDEEDDDDMRRVIVVAFIKDYVMEPDIDKGFCHVNCFIRFGVMPSLKDTITMEELDEVAKWVYDTY